MHRLIIKPFAEIDTQNAAYWYENARDGLGEEFLLAVEAKINAIKKNPKQFAVVHKNIRRALTKRFPYGIFFIIENDIVYVLAIVHLQRSPKVWQRRR